MLYEMGWDNFLRFSGFFFLYTRYLIQYPTVSLEGVPIAPLNNLLHILIRPSELKEKTFP